jgi:hypothetical protein
LLRHPAGPQLRREHLTVRLEIFAEFFWGLEAKLLEIMGRISDF